MSTLRVSDNFSQTKIFLLLLFVANLLAPIRQFNPEYALYIFYQLLRGCSCEKAGTHLKTGKSTVSGSVHKVSRTIIWQFGDGIVPGDTGRSSGGNERLHKYFLTISYCWINRYLLHNLGDVSYRSAV